jgi:hypothetical protein
LGKRHAGQPKPDQGYSGSTIMDDVSGFSHAAGGMVGRLFFQAVVCV